MQAETPQLVIDLDRVRDHYAHLAEALPDFRIAYAIKANPHHSVIDALEKKGSSFEVASIGEINRLLGQSIPPERIVFSNPIKPATAITEALQLGVNLMSFDSINELRKFSTRDGARLLLRIAVPNEGSLWPLSQKFGCDEKDWPKLFSAMQERGIGLAGITFHVGSQCESLDSWHRAMRRAWKAISLSHEYDLTPEILNIGGGFPIHLGREIPRVRDIAAVVHSHLSSWQEAGLHMKELIAEPGRFIIGEAGELHSSIIGIAERSGKKLVYIDCGIFSGLLEAIDDFTYPVESTGTGKSELVTLCGPSCDSLDMMFEVEIPAPVDGDVLTFRGAGAYSVVYASEFNGFAGPMVVPIEKKVTASKQR